MGRRARYRGTCSLCGREYALRWCVAGNVLTLRRHGWPDICDGSGCEALDGSVRNVR